MPARARPIPWPTAWRGCCWRTPGRNTSSASPSPRRRRRKCSTACSGNWATGRCCPTTSLTRQHRSIGAEPDDLPKARRLFAQALETPGGLKVLTIHAFCQIVLSRFPIEAGVPPGFDVLDDSSARAPDRRSAASRAGTRGRRRNALARRRRPSGDRSGRSAAQRSAECRAGQRPAQDGPLLRRPGRSDLSKTPSGRRMARARRAIAAGDFCADA